MKNENEGKPNQREKYRYRCLEATYFSDEPLLRSLNLENLVFDGIFCDDLENANSAEKRKKTFSLAPCVIARLMAHF